MSAEKHGIRSTVIATVISGLILWGVKSFWPSLWGWIKSLPNEIWEFLTWNPSIPIWLFLPAIVATFLMARWIYSPTVPSKGEALNPEHTDQDSSKPKQPLSDNELAVLRALVDIDEEDLYVDTISNNINLNKLRTGQALELLVQKGYVYESHNYVYGTSYYLSSEGRDLAIELGYA